MPKLTRRNFMKATGVAASVACGRELSGAGPNEASPRAAVESLIHGAQAGTPASREEIYRLLGFATMSGEDPLKMWDRLRDTGVWRVGPLSPDSWSGCVFIADDADIFGFRTVSLPAAWMKGYQQGNRAEYCGKQLEQWFAKWPEWWRRVGPKAPDNSWARLVWQMPEGGPEVTYDWAQTDKNEVVGRLTHSQPADLVVEAYIPWDSAPPKFSALYAEGPERRTLRGRSWVPGTRDGMRWVLALSIPPNEVSGTGAVRWHGYFHQVKTLYFCGRQGQSYEPLEEKTRAWLAEGRIDQLLDRNRERYMKSRPIGTGWLADGPAAINDSLEWNEVYTPERRRTYITVSRKWAQANNSAPDFLWDSFFSSLLVCQEDEARAFDLVRDITSWQNDQGMFVQYGQWVAHPDRWIFPVAWGHTQYPIGSLVTAKIYMRRPDKRFLAEIYPRLLKNQRWWFADRGDGQPWRDGNRNGLLELGSNYPEEIPYEDRQQCAYFESNDDSPQWWHVAPYNEKTQTLEQDTVERNCLYANDCWVLAWMAHELGKPDDAAALMKEHQRMVDTINRLLWDPARQCYSNRHWENHQGETFYPQMGPDIFFSLLGKVATAEQARSLRKLFHDPTKFAGEWIMPTISRDDPLFPKQDYWRGKVWPPHNWLLQQGFKLYEWDHEARLLAESSAKMFFRTWREKGECHENFSAITGEGTGQSDPHYTWGALMVLVAIEELIDVNPWHGLRFGNLEPVAPASIERYYVAGSLYDVTQSTEGLEVKRDGRLLFTSNVPAEIRHVEFEGDRVRYEIRAGRAGKLRVGMDAVREFPAGLSRGEGRI
ncbi:MAG TPA: trehalase family glycosidase [Terriglobia bacterium]|nr:trehalase family glycosidase [Terriglobia bacterium]